MTRSWGTLTVALTIALTGGWLSTFGASPDREPCAGWRVHRNEEHRFEIRYPPTWGVSESAELLPGDRVVVTFVPAQNPAFNEAGVRTNLISLCVTIAVFECAGAFGTGGERFVSEVGLDSAPVVSQRQVRFLRTSTSEGAAGNRYETSTLSTDFAGKHYEISLLVHSANPDCYPAGTLATFDSSEIERLFAAMVDSFAPIGMEYFWVLSP